MDIAVIGGGASGILSALSAAIIEPELKITILERMDRIGKKILATGNGRCNFSNTGVDISRYHGHNTLFAKDIFEKFTVDDTVSFFNSIGIFERQEAKGKLFPYSGQASSVLDCLRSALLSKKIDIITDFDVKKIKHVEGGFKIISKTDDYILCKKVIMAGGGCASPTLGSNGSAFEILKELGHKIYTPEAALVQLKTQTEDVKGLNGIKINAKAKLYVNDDFLAEDEGEILFTAYGLSGPPVFQLSALTPNKKNLYIFLDIMPLHNVKDIFEILRERKENLISLRNDMTAEDFFTGFINKRIGNIILRKSGIEKLSFKIKDMDKKKLWNIAEKLKNLDFKIIGNNGLKNAQVTAGGASVEEFCQQTLESKKVKGLYACGEVLDIYGDCGGFNLQWAWSSGFVAGKSCAMSFGAKK